MRLNSCSVNAVAMFIISRGGGDGKKYQKSIKTKLSLSMFIKSESTNIHVHK